MSKIKIIRYFLCFIFLFTMLGGLTANQVVLAAQQNSGNSFVLPPGQEEPPVEETLELESKFPILSDKSGEIPGQRTQEIGPHLHNTHGLDSNSRVRISRETDTCYRDGTRRQVPCH